VLDGSISGEMLSTLRHDVVVLSWGTNHAKVLKCLGWMTLEKRRRETKTNTVLMYDVENNRLPGYVLENFVQCRNPIVDNRNHISYRLPRNMSSRLKKLTVPSSINSWCSLPNEIKSRFSRKS
jgi:hypothetical protein